MKLFASRPQDIRDVEGVALRQGKALDWEYIDSQLRPLAEIKEDPEILKNSSRIRKL